MFTKKVETVGPAAILLVSAVDSNSKLRKVWLSSSWPEQTEEGTRIWLMESSYAWKRFQCDITTLFMRKVTPIERWLRAQMVTSSMADREKTRQRARRNGWSKEQENGSETGDSEPLEARRSHPIQPPFHVLEKIPRWTWNSVRNILELETLNMPLSSIVWQKLQNGATRVKQKSFRIIHIKQFGRIQSRFQMMDSAKLWGRLRPFHWRHHTGSLAYRRTAKVRNYLHFR
jgi:hypothetical protein